MYESWDAFVLKATVFSYCQLKKNSVNNENNNRFEKNTTIQEQNSEVHKVLQLKRAFCLKGNKILQVHHTLVNSDILKARNKLFVCYDLNLRRKKKCSAALWKFLTLLKYIDEDPLSFL